MEFNFYLPTREQVHNAKKLGLDLIETLKFFYKEIIKTEVFYPGTNKSLRMTLTDDQVKRIKNDDDGYIDLIADTFVDEMHHNINKELTKNAHEVRIDFSDSETVKDKIAEAIDENIRNGKYFDIIVTNAHLGVAISNMADFESVTFNDNNLKNCTQNIEFGKFFDGITVMVDPYMAWTDNRLLFIPKENILLN